jgi:hypothetical protein
MRYVQRPNQKAISYRPSETACSYIFSYPPLGRRESAMLCRQAVVFRLSIYFFLFIYFSSLPLPEIGNF